ncbi:MAG: hypothetical protein RL308_1939 [Bacteroidota bacterium]|jgi:RHS repeat-associated protein
MIRPSNRASIRNISDYSPFGVQLSGRNFVKTGAKESRFGFQGQEEDDELKGEGNSLNYTYRMHDPRLGRFFAVDPLAAQYPHNSPYAFSENIVINAVELEGLEKVYVYVWNTKTDSWIKKRTDTDLKSEVNRNKYVVFHADGTYTATYKVVHDETYKANKRVEKSNEWQKDLADWNQKQEQEIQDNATPEQREQSARTQAVLGPLRDYAVEAVKPVAELYKIQASLGGSGMTSGVPLSGATSTVAKNVYGSFDDIAKLASTLEKTKAGRKGVFDGVGFSEVLSGLESNGFSKAETLKNGTMKYTNGEETIFIRKSKTGDYKRYDTMTDSKGNSIRFNKE